MNTMNIMCKALANNKRIQFDYQGYPRTAEVHTIGVSKNGEQVVRVYQVGGGSRSDESTGWKIMKIDGATSITILDDAAEAPREGYRRGDRFMAEIIAEL